MDLRLHRKVLPSVGCQMRRQGLFGDEVLPVEFHPLDHAKLEPTVEGGQAVTAD